MKAKKLIAVMAASAIALSFAGCQSADTPEGSETEADAGESGIESTVTLNDTYWAGSNIRVRMLFDPEGNCRYGYVGNYALTVAEDGTQLLTMLYYADTEAGQMACTTYALRDDGDGSYTRVIYVEGESQDFDGDAAAELVLDEGTDGLSGSAAFDGVYLSSDGQYYNFYSDGTFAMETLMRYVADEDQIELVGADGSTLYTYTADEDYSTLTLYKDGQQIMELVNDETVQAETEQAEASDGSGSEQEQEEN